MSLIEIDIDNYISEDEKKELVREVYSRRIESELFKTIKGTNQSDNEIQRIVGNISHNFIVSELQKYLPDFKDLIIESVKKSIKTKNLKYQIFVKKGVYEDKNSLAVDYINQAIEQSKDIINAKVKEAISDYNYDNEVKEQIAIEFSSMADKLFSLSELLATK